jgi:hypothetical protein
MHARNCFTRRFYTFVCLFFTNRKKYSERRKIKHRVFYNQRNIKKINSTEVQPIFATTKNAFTGKSRLDIFCYCALRKIKEIVNQILQKSNRFLKKKCFTLKKSRLDIFCYCALRKIKEIVYQLL